MLTAQNDMVLFSDFYINYCSLQLCSQESASAFIVNRKTDYVLRDVPFVPSNLFCGSNLRL